MQHNDTLTARELLGPIHPALACCAGGVMVVHAANGVLDGFGGGLAYHLGYFVGTLAIGVVLLWLPAWIAWRAWGCKPAAINAIFGLLVAFVAVGVLSDVTGHFAVAEASEVRVEGERQASDSWRSARAPHTSGARDHRGGRDPLPEARDADVREDRTVALVYDEILADMLLRLRGYDARVVAFERAGGFRIDGLRDPDRIRALAAALEALRIENLELAAYVDGLGGTVFSELLESGVDPARAVGEADRFSIDARLDIVLRIRASDELIFGSLAGLYAILDVTFGEWTHGTDGLVLFEATVPDAMVDEFNARVATIRGVLQGQNRLRVEALKLDTTGIVALTWFDES